MPSDSSCQRSPWRMKRRPLLNNAGDERRARAIVITGAGDRAFCAGQDLTESAVLAAGAGPEWMAGWRRYFEAVSSCPIPIVAAINGVAAGAGLETALMADIRIARARCAPDDG
jgi:enoyl-CoA hydratase